MFHEAKFQKLLVYKYINIQFLINGQDLNEWYANIAFGRLHPPHSTTFECCRVYIVTLGDVRIQYRNLYLIFNNLTM